MAKSTLRPINKIENVTEIRLRVPTDAVAKPAVNIKPETSVASEEISRVTERKPRYKRPTTNINDIIPRTKIMHFYI